MTSQTNHNFEWPDSNLLLLTTWNPICVNYNSRTQRLNIFVNGTDVLNNKYVGNEDNILINSSIELGGVRKDPFSGKITDLNIWNRPLTENEIKGYSLNCDESMFAPEQPLLWSKLNFSAISNNSNVIQLASIKYEKLCKPLAAKTKIFPTKTNFKESLQMCNQLSGKMPLPRNLTEVAEVVKSSGKKFSDLKLLQAWLPIVRSSENSSEWVSSDPIPEKVNFLNWASGQPNGALIDQNCIIVTADSLGYGDVACDELHFFSCSLESNFLFKLKGLYEAEDEIDSDYLFLIDMIDSGSYTFQGVTGLTSIVYNNSSALWEIKSLLNSSAEVVLGLYNGTVLSPLGTQDWFVKHSSNQFRRRQMKLTMVSSSYSI